MTESYFSEGLNSTQQLHTSFLFDYYNVFPASRILNVTWGCYSTHHRFISCPGGSFNNGVNSFPQALLVNHNRIITENHLLSEDWRLYPRFSFIKNYYRIDAVEAVNRYNGPHKSYDYSIEVFPWDDNAMYLSSPKVGDSWEPCKDNITLIIKLIDEVVYG